MTRTLRRGVPFFLSLCLLLPGCTDDPETDAGVDAGFDAGSDEDAGRDAGSDAGSDPDAGFDAGPVACDDLAPVATNLVISEIQPGEYVELFNPSDTDVDLTTSDHWFCSPFIYVPLSAFARSVPARGYLAIDWPFTVGVSAAVEAGGELILYSAPTDFDDGGLMVDFVCWGVRPAMSRKTIAEGAGRWTGECATAVPASGSIHRVMGSDGQGPASYDTSAPPSRLSCAP